ncbi:ABC transporter A family member 9-like isoform X2 [Dysidea avara]|uniref:ABC transporter A family member 9-like isoform X2 n=1 Tax=Dysidea avara TaxID=196820 RepID=UPI00332BF40E
MSTLWQPAGIILLHISPDCFDGAFLASSNLVSSCAQSASYCDRCKCHFLLVFGTRPEHTAVRRMEVKKSSDRFAANLLFLRRLKAVFLKDLTLQRRNITTLLCQVLVPVMIISIAGILQILLDVIVKTNYYINLVPGSGEPPVYSDVTWMVACKHTSDQPNQCYIDVINIGYFINNPGVKSDIDMPWIDYYRLEYLRNFSYPPQRVLFNLPFLYYVNNAGKDLGCMTYDGNVTGFLGNALPPPLQYNFTLNFTINPHYQDPMFDSDPVYSGNTVHVPFLMELPSEDDLVNRLITVIRDYSHHGDVTTSGDDQFDRNYRAQPISQLQYETIMQYVQDRNFSSIRPHAGVIFNKIEEQILVYTVVAPSFQIVYHLASLNFSSFYTSRWVQASNLVHNAYLKHLTGNDQESDPMIDVRVMSLPTTLTKDDIDLTISLYGILYPLATSFIIPVFVAGLVKDKHERHLIMMEQCGLSRPAYTVIQYLFNYCLYLIITMVITVISLAFHIRLFTQTNWLVLLVILFSWGHGAVVMGFFFSNFFNKPRTAVVISYLLVITGVVISLMLNLFNVFSENKTPPFFFMMYPPFSFYRILFYLHRACSRYQCYSSYMLKPCDSNLFLPAWLYLMLSSLVTMVMSMYLSYVLPSEYGVRKSVFFPIIGLYKLLCGRKKHCQPDISVSLSINPCDEEIFSLMSDDEINGSVKSCDDVTLEEEYIANNYDEIDAPLVVNKLRKEYSSNGGPTSVAVHGFSVVVNRNECFGLLGPNGAGKTTLISLLTGLYEPTSGAARVAGYDLATETGNITNHLGVCPQYDIQYDKLTVKEHLLFYARIRGVYRRCESDVVTGAMKQVNLLDVTDKKSKQLSGGMRRCLSVAIACVGDPDMIFLDEPTRGLDPAARRQVWEVINNVKQNKCVILTTHAMEEADHLCTRIGIMNYGKLCCLGSQNKLKARFGSGYQLHINCYSGRSSAIQQFMSSHFSSATLVEYYANKMSYKIDKEKLVVSKLFTLLNSVKIQLGITDWGIKRSTLEDVFLTIVKHQDR